MSSSPPNRQNVLITGGSQGLGYAIVQALLLPPHDYAFSICITSRHLSKGQKAVDELLADERFKPSLALGSEVWAAELDLDDDASIERMFQAVKGKWNRRVDVLVNNSGQSSAI